jgi:hypothetical protein
MKIKKTHTIFIDTKLDVSQNPSNFNVRLNNWFVRNNILNTDSATKSEWFISIKNFAIINSFSNITKNINDKLILYTSFDETTDDLLPDFSNVVGKYYKQEIIIPQGNPNVIDISDQINKTINSYNLQCLYRGYDSKYQFRITPLSTDKRKRYIIFENTYDIMGFSKDKMYFLDNQGFNEFVSEKPVNLLADRLIKFSIGNNSDIRLKNMNYCNHSSLYDECNMFFLQAVNVQSYELIYYQRTTEDLIPVELLGNSIRNIEILARNQDNDIIEGLSNYIMVLELINIKEYDYQKKIYNVLFDIYMWIATFLRGYI